MYNNTSYNSSKRCRKYSEESMMDEISAFPIMKLGNKLEE